MERTIPRALGIPGINISQFDSGLVGINIGAFTEPLVGYSASLPWVRAEANIDLVDNVTKTHGNHTFTFGFDMRRIRDDLLQTQTYSPRGAYFFGTSQTNCAGNCQLPNGTTSSATTPNSTTSWANDMASFLLDSPQASSTGRDFSGTFPTYRAWYFFPYVSDRWQVSKKLTVDPSDCAGNCIRRACRPSPASFPTSFRRTTRWWSAVWAATPTMGAWSTT